MPRRRPRLYAILLLAVAAASFPLGALASHDFGDVPDSNPFHADISALAAAGVTTGCGGGNYCPAAFVTREQMAAFMNRLGALAHGKTPVVNAGWLDGFDSTAFVMPGDLVQTYSPQYIRNGTTTSGTIVYGMDLTRVSSAIPATVTVPLQLAIVRPTSEFGIDYGLKAVEICASGSFFGYVTNAIVRGYEPFTAPSFEVASATNRQSDGCFTLAPATVAAWDGHLAVYVNVQFDAADEVDLHAVTVTWSPLP